MDAECFAKEPSQPVLIASDYQLSPGQSRRCLIEISADLAPLWQIEHFRGASKVRVWVWIVFLCSCGSI